MEKICFVVQRYGLEVNGGAELHCRQLAEQLCPFYDVTVLTTRAVDYITWADEYSESEEEICGVHVKRFGVEHPRDIVVFNEVNTRFANGELKSRKDEMEWLEKQGPLVPELLRYIEDNKTAYKVFLFFTYLYYPTVMGLPLVNEKAILIPTAHKEPCLEMGIYKDIFHLPKAIFYNTREERFLSEFVFENEGIINDIGGVGIELPEIIKPENFKQKYGLKKYLVYTGRIDTKKGCERLFIFFKQYKRNYPGDLKLVLIGKAVIDVPEHEDIIPLGFVSEEDKFNGMAGAEALVLPSTFESLSIVVLESLGLGRPVVVNGECDVLVGHCLRSNAGFYYTSYDEFEGILNYILSNKKVIRKMGVCGKRYINENYRWDIIVRRLRKLIDIES